jgi:hypothetical protein
MSTEADDYVLVQEYPSYLAAAGARDNTVACNAGRLSTHDFRITIDGQKKVMLFEVRAHDPATPEIEVVIDTWETYQVAQWQLDYEISVSRDLPADAFRIVEVEAKS